MLPSQSRLMPQSIVLASGNAKKIAELRPLLQPLGVDLIGLSQLAERGLSDIGEIIEDGDTFAANAAIKAKQAAQKTGLPAIGEDSGIKIDALDGRPGVYSARYAGPECNDDANNALMLKELDGVPDEKRGAGYVCHITLAAPDGSILAEAEAACRGRIGYEPRGSHGFGYDPYFVIPEYHKTFAELGPAVKKALSHRGRALAIFLPRLRAALQQLRNES